MLILLICSAFDVINSLCDVRYTLCDVTNDLSIIRYSLYDERYRLNDTRNSLLAQHFTFDISCASMPQAISSDWKWSPP